MQYSSRNNKTRVCHFSLAIAPVIKYFRLKMVDTSKSNLDFWKEIETEVNESIPDLVKVLFTKCGYNSRMTIGELLAANREGAITYMKESIKPLQPLPIELSNELKKELYNGIVKWATGKKLIKCVNKYFLIH